MERVAIITGAGSDGQGRATARLFASQGISVIVTDKNEAGLRETERLVNAEHPDCALAVVADITKSDQVRNVVDAAIAKYGRLDFLINNAGMTSWKTALESSEEEWDEVVDVNLKSVFLFAKYAIPHMQDAGGGSIVNISSFSGLAGLPAHVAYCSAKAGVVNLTRCLALDHGPDDIRTNCICPGAVMTEMLRLGVDYHDPEQKAAVEQRNPLRRLAEPEEIASVSLFLCSDAASYINGAILPVDGGVSAGMAR